MSKPNIYTEIHLREVRKANQAHGRKDQVIEAKTDHSLAAVADYLPWCGGRECPTLDAQ